MSADAKIYLALGLAVLVVWWAINHQAISPAVTEQVGSVGTGAQ